jgi:hypothetical protein
MMSRNFFAFCNYHKNVSALIVKSVQESKNFHAETQRLHKERLCVFFAQSLRALFSLVAGAKPLSGFIWRCVLSHSNTE